MTMYTKLLQMMEKLFPVMVQITLSSLMAVESEHQAIPQVLSQLQRNPECVLFQTMTNFQQ